ncbi:MAG: phosphoribosylformylglycinamidine cyclo-ligase [Bdellovibrionaceae bacterium]|nr:phosphoribosylformylglycinamidine cyclo-ligase [Bdellovibrio sp.]
MIDYKKSGVDIQAGDDLVSWLQQPAEKPHPGAHSKSTTSVTPSILKVKSDVPDIKSRVVSGIGGFAALFDGRFQNMQKPLLISCTDGVGTKVKVASHFGDFSTVGQDLVGMCANDLICTGGTPLFFLDYYAVEKLNLEHAQSFLTSIRNACERSHMVLIGGETAEMPGVYQPGDFDCAGFSVGVVDQEKMWGAHRVQANDVVIGLESSGFHSNGFSLIRKVFAGEFDKYRQWLLEPTRLYVEAALHLKNDFEIHAAAHMTGGGIDNLPRVLPEHLKAVLNKWELPECFREVQKRSGLSDQAMRETFNCGIGLTLIVPAGSELKIIEKLRSLNYPAQVLGKITSRMPEEAHVSWV